MAGSTSAFTNTVHTLFAVSTNDTVTWINRVRINTITVAITNFPSGTFTDANTVYTLKALLRVAVNTITWVNRVWIFTSTVFTYLSRGALVYTNTLYTNVTIRTVSIFTWVNTLIGTIPISHARLTIGAWIRNTWITAATISGSTNIAISIDPAFFTRPTRVRITRISASTTAVVNTVTVFTMLTRGAGDTVTRIAASTATRVRGYGTGFFLFFITSVLLGYTFKGYRCTASRVNTLISLTLALLVTTDVPLKCNLTIIDAICICANCQT